MKTRTFPFHVDPGHGWVKVPRQLLADLNIEQAISHYSYQRGDFVYLEEDCDLWKFKNAMDASGVACVYRERHADNRSRIRGYDSFKPQPLKVALVWEPS